MELPVRLMGHNCEEEIERIQGYLDLIEQEIDSIKTKNPDAEVVMDPNTDGLFFVLGTRETLRDGWNGDYWETNYCYEDVVHRFNGFGVVSTKMEHYSDYHTDGIIRRSEDRYKTWW